MGTASDAVRRLVVHSGQARSLFISTTYGQEQLQGPVRRANGKGSAGTIGKAIAAPVRGSYGPMEDETRTIEGA
jgi:hypothetical protein